MLFQWPKFFRQFFQQSGFVTLFYHQSFLLYSRNPSDKKVVKQEMNDGSYYSIAQWEIPTFAWYNNYFVFNAKVGISH